MIKTALYFLFTTILIAGACSLAFFAGRLMTQFTVPAMIFESTKAVAIQGGHEVDLAPVVPYLQNATWRSGSGLKHIDSREFVLQDGSTLTIDWIPGMFERSVAPGAYEILDADKEKFRDEFQRMIRQKKAQPVDQHNAGSRPSTDDLPASDTRSSLAPRG